MGFSRQVVASGIFFINIFLFSLLAKILQVCSCVVSVHQKKVCQCKLRTSVLCPHKVPQRRHLN